MTLFIDEQEYCINHFGQNSQFSDGKSSPQRMYCNETDTTLIWLHHGLPYNSGSSTSSCVKMFFNADDVMERMIEHGWLGKDYILLIDTGVHFSHHNPITLASRLLAIRDMADKLKQINPDTMIIYRSTSMNRGSSFKTSGLIGSFQQNRLSEVGVRIFKDSKSVILMDSWDIIESVFDKMHFGDIHPPSDVSEAELSYIFDLYCYHSNEC